MYELIIIDKMNLSSANFRRFFLELSVKIPAINSISSNDTSL